MSPAAARPAGPGPIPRPLLAVGIPVAAVLLTALFVFLGFPYERVRESLALQLGAATGSEVTIADLAPGLSPLGPALVARDVRITRPGGTAHRLEQARLRPAWSTAWLRGSPALAVALSAAEGRVDGTLYAGPEPGFDGDLEDLDLGALPLGRWLPELALDGRLSADVDVRSRMAGPEGRLSLRAADGSIALPGIPMALPFATLEGDLELGEGVRIERLDLDGPMLAVQGEGSIGAGPVDRAPLDLRLRLEVREVSVRPMLSGLGVRLGPDGTADLRVTGTAGRPSVRSER